MTELAPAYNSSFCAGVDQISGLSEFSDWAMRVYTEAGYTYAECAHSLGSICFGKIQTLNEDFGMTYLFANNVTTSSAHCADLCQNRVNLMCGRTENESYQNGSWTRLVPPIEALAMAFFILWLKPAQHFYPMNGA